MKNYWSLKFCRIAAATVVAVSPFFATAQFSKQEVTFSKNQNEKYLYPINPGQPGSLAGTMGELRATHFHSGIDIRTNNMTGFPVHASKSGYISRAAMSTTSYGNVLYITHPDGNTTLYAHLDKFQGVIADHILAEQYKMKSNEIDLFFAENQFIVKQGEVIGLSGNSGSSGGPHLHFDIRDSNNFALDPLKVAGFTEITDNLPPAPEKIAVRTLTPDSRINDRFGRFEFHGNKVGNNYIIASPILASGVIGVEILAKDKLAYKSPFFGGVNYLELWVDSTLVFKQDIDKIELAETRAIYTLMDFKTMRNMGTRFYKLYLEDGNTLPYYSGSPSTGRIKINMKKESVVKVKMTDSRNNSSTVTFKLRPNPVVKEVSSLEAMTTNVAYDLTENTLLVSARSSKEFDAKAILYTKGNSEELEPAYANINRKVYLLDLRKNIPDSIRVNNETVTPNIKVTIPPTTEYKYYSDVMDIQFPTNAVYDTLYLSAKYSKIAEGNEIFSIGSRTMPLRKSIDVSLKPGGTYPATKQYSIYRINGRSYSYVGGQWDNGRINFSTREFGEYTILQDSVEPSIKPISINNQTVRFKIKDNLSGIASFNAYINGEWLLMHYDYKIATIWSERLRKNLLLKGTLELIVTDNAGNQSKYTQKIP